jgi:spore coat protein SA
MRLLIIAPGQYPVPNVKGTSVENCIINIAGRLARRHHVTIVSRKTPQLPPRSRHGNLTIIRVPGGSRAAYLAGVSKAIRGKTFDVIQIDNRPSYLAAVRQIFPHTPISLFLHSLTFVTPPMASVRTVRSQLSAADLIVANSHSLKKQLTMRFPAQAKKIRVVHLGVNLAQFRPPTAAERRKVRKQYRALGKFCIVYAGRFIPIKGIPQLIRAAEMVHRRVPSARLFLAGGGTSPYAARIRRMARRAKLPVHLMGYLPRKSVHRAYWLADCLVCPTQGHESFGLVVAEAMACGVPVVASRTGGIPEIIRHNRTGLLVASYRRPSAFANAILRIARSKKLARRLGTAARAACARRFSWQMTSARLERLYRQL